MQELRTKTRFSGSVGISIFLQFNYSTLINATDDGNSIDEKRLASLDRRVVEEAGIMSSHVIRDNINIWKTVDQRQTIDSSHLVTHSPVFSFYLISTLQFVQLDI